MYIILCLRLLGQPDIVRQPQSFLFWKALYYFRSGTNPFIPSHRLGNLKYKESLLVINYFKLPLKRVGLRNMNFCRSGIHMGLMARSFSTGVPTACRLVGGLSLSTHKSLIWQLTAWQKAQESEPPQMMLEQNLSETKATADYEPLHGLPLIFPRII